MLYFLYVFYKLLNFWGTFWTSQQQNTHKIFTIEKKKKKKIRIWGYVMEFPLLFQAIVR